VVLSVTGVVVGGCVFVVIRSVDVISVVASRAVPVSMVEEANCVSFVVVCIGNISGVVVWLGLHAVPRNVLKSHEFFVNLFVSSAGKERCDVIGT
jgi:hypothetical protein